MDERRKTVKGYSAAGRQAAFIANDVASIFEQNSSVADRYRASQDRSDGMAVINYLEGLQYKMYE